MVPDRRPPPSRRDLHVARLPHHIGIMSSNDDGSPRAERPRSEPEIIPPGGAIPERTTIRSGWDSDSIWVGDPENGQAFRFRVARPGPFTIILALVVAGLIAIAALLFFLTAVLIWVPVVVAVVAGAFIAAWARRHWRRLRGGA
jgi:hypothetical protein